ncbi:hypothetical protein [Mucilaginibacter sp. SP1R1]|uniref:hypothetical protein n=1 Tax=Mucilaginibacter sp. SP1R1 TaxID=2723091 RepID=UPI00161AE385|nr:hypothetical protein [Mucilaginibacter sp. SP1R1]MBB6148226.1 hypothetical protein [Mucilaginibacter sp. SP1R1]
MPITLYAQDTTVVRNQANVLAQAMIKGDYETVINNTYPKAVQMGGGTEKMLKLIYLGIGQLKSAGISFEAISIGEPGKFYNAGDEIHCLVPENITLKTPKGRILSHSNLLAISNDGGKNWTFLDLNNSNTIRIKQLLPNFNPELKIPPATTEQLQ